MTARPLRLDPDRRFPADPSTRATARARHVAIAALTHQRTPGLVRRAYRIDQPLPALRAA